MKLRKGFYLFLVTILLVTVLPACQRESPATPDASLKETAQLDIVEITENVEKVTTWAGNKVYVIKKWDFQIKSQLSIEPGAVIKFHPEEGPVLSVTGEGAIIARGTSDKTIVFTSYRDDSYGGDTNGDRNKSAPGPGDWNGIYIEENGSIFDHCRFHFGGPNKVLEAWDCSVRVVSSVLAHNEGRALDLRKAINGTVVEDNIFYGNEKPLAISANFDLGDSNVFHNPDARSETNTYNGIFLEYVPGFRINVTWLETEVPFVVDHNDLWVEEDASLTLGDNVIIKFTPGSSLNHYSNIVNHDGTGVIFTSFLDDEHGGDTNADGSATLPTAGDWKIHSIEGIVAWTNVHYAGEIGPQVEGPVVMLADLQLPIQLEPQVLSKLEAVEVATVQDLLNRAVFEEDISELSVEADVPQDDILRLAFRAELRSVLGQQQLSASHLEVLEMADLDSISQLSEVPVESSPTVDSLHYHLSQVAIARGEPASAPSREQIISWVEKARTVTPIYNVMPSGIVLPSGETMLEDQEFYTLEPISPTELLRLTPVVVRGEPSVQQQHPEYQSPPGLDMAMITGGEEPYDYSLPVYGESFHRTSLTCETFGLDGWQGDIEYDCEQMPDGRYSCTVVGPSGEETIILPGNFEVSLVDPDGEAAQLLHVPYDFDGLIYFYTREPGLWKVRIASDVTIVGRFRYQGAVFPEPLPAGTVQLTDGDIAFYRYTVPPDHGVVTIELDQDEESPSSRGLRGRTYLAHGPEKYLGIGGSDSLIKIEEDGQVTFQTGLQPQSLFQVTAGSVINLVLGLGTHLSPRSRQVEMLNPEEDTPVHVYNRAGITHTATKNLDIQFSDHVPGYYIGTMSSMVYSDDADPGIMGHGEMFSAFDTEVSDAGSVQQRFFSRYPYMKWAQLKSGDEKLPFIWANVPTIAMEEEALESYEGYKLSFSAYEDDVEWAEFLYRLITGDVLIDLISAVSNAVACVAGNVLSCAAAACNLLSVGTGVYQEAGEDADDFMGSAYLLTSREYNFAEEGFVYTLHGAPEASEETDLSDTMGEIGDVCLTVATIGGDIDALSDASVEQIFDSMMDPDILTSAAISEAEDRLGSAMQWELMSKFEGDTPPGGHWIQGNYVTRRVDTVWTDQIRVKFVGAEIHQDRDGFWTGDGDMEVFTYVGTVGEASESSNSHSLDDLSESPFTAADIHRWCAGDVGSGETLTANRVIFERVYNGKNVSSIYVEIGIWDDDIGPDDEVARLSTQWDLNSMLGSGIGQWQGYGNNRWYVIPSEITVRSNYYNNGESYHYRGATFRYEIWLR